MIAAVTSQAVLWSLFGAALAAITVTAGALHVGTAAWHGTILTCGDCQYAVYQRTGKVGRAGLITAGTCTGLMLSLLTLAALTGVS